MMALETPPLPLMIVGGASVFALLLFALWLCPVYSSVAGRCRAGIEALRERLAQGAPEDEVERARLEPYAFALDIEWAKGLDLSPRAPDKEPARSMRPLRHTRSAAA
jgi:hypothetical protein